MSNQPNRGPRPTFNVRGAVDLSALSARRPAGPPAATTATGAAAAAGAPAAARSAGVIDVTDDSFVADVVQRSNAVPVVIDFWATWCGPCKQLSPVLERLTIEFGGRFLLAKIDVDANPKIAQAFQVQSIPSVFAVIKGQPVPLFEGAQPEAQVRQVLTELLRVAQANGVTGTVPLDVADEAVAQESAAEESLPPLHQDAYDAIERGDLLAAVAAYEQALKESPADDLARIGLSQVRLMERTQNVDSAVARAAAAAAPLDVDAQIVVADLDLLGGHVQDAFTRLIDLVRQTSGAERDRARLHLVELFDLVGAQDPRVPAARLALANALF